MPKVETREYRIMPAMAAVKRAEGDPGTAAAEEAAEKSYKVRGYATTFNDPYVLYEGSNGEQIFEVIDGHAFDDADMSDVIMQYDHSGMVYARTRNGSLNIGTDEHGLWIEADLSLTEESRKLYDAIDKGLIDRMSFCFTIAADDWDSRTNTSTVLKIAKLYDVSAVSIPANPGTDISAERKKRMDGAIQEARAERLAEEARKRKIKILRTRARAVRAMGAAGKENK